jgi:hypothetical protein
MWRVDGGRAAERASMWAAMQQVGWGMAAARQEERRGVREQLLRVYIRRVRVLVGWTLGPKVLAIGPRT